MADGTPPLTAETSGLDDAGAIVFALAGDVYAVPVDRVEGIAAAPALSRVPHAPPGLLGAANLGGQVVPVIDLAALLPDADLVRRYDGSGEILRLRAAGGSIGLWIDRTERLVDRGAALDAAIRLVQPDTLVQSGITAPRLDAEARRALGDAGELAEPVAATTEAAFFLVETAGEAVRLPYETVQEFVEPPPWVALPGAPAGFLGVGILRGEALPMLSLATLLDLPRGAAPATYAVVLPAGGRRVLLGCDRIVGLRTAEDGRLFDPRTAVPKSLRRIVAGFERSETAQAGAADEAEAGFFLSFMANRQLYALPVEAVERVVPPQPAVALPRSAARPGVASGAIELRGQIIPVVPLDGAADGGSPGVYVVLRGEAGFLALGAERAERVIALKPEQIAPPPNDNELIDGVAVLDDARHVLRILAPQRIGDAR